MACPSRMGNEADAEGGSTFKNGKKKIKFFFAVVVALKLHQSTVGGKKMKKKNIFFFHLDFIVCGHFGESVRVETAPEIFFYFLAPRYCFLALFFFFFSDSRWPAELVDFIFYYFFWQHQKVRGTVPTERAPVF